MFDARIRPLIDPPMARLAARLAGQGLTANGVTVTGFVIGLVAIIAISQQLFWIGLLGLMINRFCDGLDGALARQAGPTDLGGFLDIVLDFIIYAGFVFGFALADPVANGLPAAFLLFSFMGTGSSFLAFAIMAEKRQISTDIRGRKSLYYLGGLTEGTETILVLALCCVLPFWFPQIAVVFGFMCWVTTVARIFWGYQALR